MKRKLKPVFEPVKEFMHEVKSDFKEFAGEIHLDTIMSSLNCEIRIINAWSDTLSAQSDDNYIKYGDLMYPSDILEMISSNRRTDRKKDKKVKYKLNIEEIFERADKSKIEFQENLEIIKEYLNSIKDFIKDNNSKYRNIYYDTKNEIDELYPKFQEAVKKYNNIKTQIENLLNQAKKIN